MKRLTTRMIASALMGSCLIAASSSWAAEVWLRAETLTKDLPGKPGVLMWGFALDADQDFTTTDGAATVPGPTITVLETDPTLVIRLKNNLTVPVSIVIPNQNGFVRDAAHGTFTDAQGRTRARSFVKETAPGAEVTYTWNNLTPGTYLYYSGSHSALQVQMGLYGAMVRNAAAGSVVVDTEQVLVFSEIDTKVHDAVAIGNYRNFQDPAWAPANPAQPVVNSTIKSVPDYFLINGTAYEAGQPSLAAGNPGQTVLLRMLNASVNARVPVIYGLEQEVIAEDGRLYPYPKQLSAPELPALKTMDVLVRPTAAGTYPLYDRALGLVNGTQSPGGMLTYLQVVAPLVSPTRPAAPAPRAVQKPVRTAAVAK